LESHQQRKLLIHSAQLQSLLLSAQVLALMELHTYLLQQRTSMAPSLYGHTEFAQQLIFQQLLHLLVHTQLPTLQNLVR
jgi:hypothetical protein